MLPASLSAASVLQQGIMVDPSDPTRFMQQDNNPNAVRHCNIPCCLKSVMLLMPCTSGERRLCCCRTCSPC